MSLSVHTRDILYLPAEKVLAILVPIYNPAKDLSWDRRKGSASLYKFLLLLKLASRLAPSDGCLQVTVKWVEICRRRRAARVRCRYYCYHH